MPSNNHIIAISGASGLIGGKLAANYSSQGLTVLRLVRRPANDRLEVSWDPISGSLEIDKLNGVDTIFHLAGENVAARRWNSAVMHKLRASRVDATTSLVAALQRMKSPPKHLICASAVGYYGDRGDELLDEKSPPGDNFLASLAQDWEAAALKASNAMRVTLARLGVVISCDGGALKKMLPAFKLGLGGPIGAGQQYMSWVTLTDVVKALAFIAEKELVGPINVVAPNPVANLEFTKALGKILRRPTYFAAPPFILRTLFGKMAGEMLLSSQRVTPSILVNGGFIFDDPSIETALNKLILTQP